MLRLHPTSSGELNAVVQQPHYDRSQLRAGIVHLGLGAFHRAHQAVYTDDAIAHSGGDWGIVGVSLRSAEVAQQLLPQDGLYSVMSEDATHSQIRVIAAIQDVLVATEQLADVIAAIARQDIKLVTLTITEKGYTVANRQSLDRQDPAVQADLANPAQPRTAVGILALGLQQRMLAGGAPLTVMSCDNLSANSTVLRTVLVDYLGDTFPAVLPWLDSATCFPCSMVDRIVPAMTDEMRQRQSQLLGVFDAGAVNTEPFSQWIIEDTFASGRPDWESAGAILVKDIAPYETIKLRLLNAAHSAIAYCGLLAGLRTVDEVMADATLRPFVEALMSEELAPALHVPEGFDLAAYREQLLARFSNPRLGHRCAQIAMDGSEKIRQRWLPTLCNPEPAPRLVVALSAWCYFILYTALPIDDPRAEQLLQLRSSAATDRDRVISVLDCARINPDTLGQFTVLREALERNLATIARSGVRSLLMLQ